MGYPNFEFWGLDLETSGTNPNLHAPIQVGLVAPTGKMFVSNIGGWKFRSAEEYYFQQITPIWDEDAAAIHGITQDELIAAPYSFQIASSAASFVREQSKVDKTNRIMVGWNVASFDLDFLRHHMVRLADVFAYRTVDLNALCFTISHQSEKHTFDTLKTQAMEAAVEAIGYEDRHDALWDAQAALVSFQYLSDITNRST